MKPRVSTDGKNEETIKNISASTVEETSIFLYLTRAFVIF